MSNYDNKPVETDRTYKLTTETGYDLRAILSLGGSVVSLKGAEYIELYDEAELNGVIKLLETARTEMRKGPWKPVRKGSK